MLERLKQLEESLKECLEGVKELNGEYQDGWDDVINRAEKLLNEDKDKSG